MTQQNKMREAFEKWEAGQDLSFDEAVLAYTAWQAAWSHNEPIADNSGLVEWQPIETAPKDGTQILLCQRDDADGKPIRDDAFGIFCQVAAWWGDEDDGEWVVYCSLSVEPRVHFTPTHWQPLPCPPTAIQNNAKMEEK